MRKLSTFGHFLLFMLALGYPAIAQYTAQNAFPNLTFSSPIEMTSPDDETNRIFVASQTGVIHVFPNRADVLSSKVFLNISSRIAAGGEAGLLGLAFHPNYRNNGYFYVNYTRNNPNLESVIARFRVSTTDPDQADPGSELILLTFSQPFANHNGGKVVFGNDGFLYMATGDGGSGGDPNNYAQNRASLLGKILRIDVDNAANNLNYAIPANNPFANNTEGFRKEIYAYGMRNPWKISVDKVTGQIWAADVGQNGREEVDLIINGGNYGWRLMEGFACYNPSTCDTTGRGLINPILEYTHDSGAGRSITGGFVYRGAAMPNLIGKYVYGDYVSRNVWSLQYGPNQEVTNTLLFQAAGNILAFGEDQEHHLYLCLATGIIQKIVDPTAIAITSFTPASGSAGTTVTLTGTQFSPVPAENTVKFGEVLATVTAASASSLTVTVPEAATIGDVLITVTANGKTASSIRPFSVNKRDQTITFSAISNKIANDAPFTLEATASSGLQVLFEVVSGPATLDGNTVTLTGPGTVRISASQPGNENYLPATAVERDFTVMAVTGLEAIAQENVSIYPNPAREAFTVKIAGSVNFRPASLELYNPIGKKVTAQAFNLIADTNEITIPVRALAKGMYLVRFWMGDQLIQRKLIIE
jgi:glucose/arabinose dehydrogenase